MGKLERRFLSCRVMKWLGKAAKKRRGRWEIGGCQMKSNWRGWQVSTVQNGLDKWKL
jgi:hypothetical protein